ncbi:bile acid:sodium symporter family protein [Streptacidiphilus rugosus]|uniref:bile acid:sodium symporter family protein n=1 Tax=Streptacidiphilus rugosus TaxID=405783 RepID=UPI00068B17CA|nr:bile acid:sodium symporter [Streptacidiphilus rugosus]
MKLLGTLAAAVQRRLLWIMLLAYVLAAARPGPGQALRGVTLARFDGAAFPLQAGLLALMVFNAGLTARSEALPALLRHPRALLVGIASNALLPTLLLGVGALAADGWHNVHEAQSLLVGLALVGAMPVAAGATVFAQGSEGNATLTLGLVVGSTLLSPLTIPLGLHLGGFLASGPYAADLHAVAEHACSAFAVLAVVLPCAAGLLTGRLLGARLGPVLPLVRAAGLAVVVLLSYTNACGALRQVVERPDPDYLVLVVVAAAAMCGGSFLSGWVLAGRLGVPRADAIALTYASGMNNSSAGAVVAATRLPGNPAVLLPILAYSLLQKVLASSVGALVRNAPFGDEGSAGSTAVPTAPKEPLGFRRL